MCARHVYMYAVFCGAGDSRDSMDRRPDVQRNLDTSGSTALHAFLDGSADLSSFSRWVQGLGIIEQDVLSAGHFTDCS